MTCNGRPTLLSKHAPASRTAVSRWPLVMARTLALSIALPSALHAQIVRGAVVDAADRGVPGVVVSLIDSAQITVARSLTDDRGEYRVAAPRAGTYRLRTMRIGYQPSLSNTIVLHEGTVTVERVVLDGVRVTLAAVRVLSRSVCGRRSGDEAGSTFAVWDQAMTAIAATNLTASTRGLTATIMQIERTLEPDGRRVRWQTATVRTDNVTQPWRSLPPDTLRRRGYKSTDRSDVTTFNAPGLDVLVSPLFIEDHCLRLAKGNDSSEVGVSFEPTPQRMRMSEIRGTLWLDRASAELRRMEYRFTSLPGERADYPAGGTMSFERLPNGSMVISAWDIRMPNLVKDSPTDTRVRVAEVTVSGGQLLVMRRNADTLYKRPPLVVAGVVQDSLSGAPLHRATISLFGTNTQTVTDTEGRFSLTDVLPGEYMLAIRTPSLDSVRTSSQSAILVVEGMAPLRVRVPTASQLAVSLCGATLSAASGRGRGVVLGTVRDGSDSSQFGGMPIVADWSEVVVRGSSLERLRRRLETKTDATGAFRLCGVPTEATMVLRALPNAGRSQSVTVRLSPDERFASTVLPIDRARPAVATLFGVVAADSSGRMLADAEVAIPALALTTRTNARGEFRLTDVPVGTHEIFARRVGYGAMTASITFAANDEEERRLVLRPLTVLEDVAVTAKRADPAMLEFDEHRKLGLGHFVTREELAKNPNLKMGEVLAMVPGAGVARGRSSGAYLLSKRFTIPMCERAQRTQGLAIARSCSGVVYHPSNTERTLGIIAGCYALVYLDNRLMNFGKPTEPFDINSVPVDQIEGLEWYAGGAQTPARYSTLNSNCGVLVIHTRRFDGGGSTPLAR